MKNYPLFIQICVVFALITLLISGILFFVLPHTLRDFFTNEMYATINAAQESFIQPYNLDTEKKNKRLPEYYIENNLSNDDIRTVKHFIIYPNGSFTDNLVDKNSIPLELIMRSKQEALLQREISVKYSMELGTNKIFYIITRVSLVESVGPIVSNQEVALVSYLNDSYREDLVRTLFNKLLSLTGLILILSWIMAIFFSGYLSKPLVILEKRVEKLTNRQWEEEISLDRRDEIGKLAKSINSLRLELIRQDQAEQSFLQNISHELKTPIMVIKSYSQAIADGIFPNGSLQSSLDVIGSETDRLEDKVKSLLYITKLDYLSSFDLVREEFSLNDLINDVVIKLGPRRKDILWEINIDNISIKGDLEQIKVAIENILDNALRYAKTKISISSEKTSKGSLLRIWNDGSSIDEGAINNIFEKFHKGRDGEIGLGLAIVKRIITIHGFKIYARNEGGGVGFYIEIVEE